MKILSFIFLLILTGQAQAHWDLNDVSYLMPLPASLEKNSLLKLQTKALGGVLLDPQLIVKMPRLTVPIPNEEIIEKLRVVGVRIDPCFPLPTPLECQKQVRLIWQPIELNRQQQVDTIDTAVHSFYHLKDQEFQTLLTKIADWKKKFPYESRGLALQVHPAWVDKPESPALLEFQRLLTESIGQENFFRATAMLLRGAGDMWAFESFEFRQGSFEMQPIPRLEGRIAQTFVNIAVPSDHFEGGGMSPRPTGDDVISHLVADSEQVKGEVEEMVLNEFQVLAKIENPKTFNPENMDCVSCHVVQSAKHWALANRADLKLSTLWSGLEYKNSNYNLENQTMDVRDTQNLRSFGYFRRNPALSQRVINESAEVADQLNQIFPVPSH